MTELEILVSLAVWLLAILTLQIYISTKEKRILYKRQVAYDAVCYADEKAEDYLKETGVKVNKLQKADFAVEYMQMEFGFMSRRAAVRYCMSICAKTVNVGATGVKKI